MIKMIQSFLPIANGLHEDYWTVSPHGKGKLGLSVEDDLQSPCDSRSDNPFLQLWVVNQLTRMAWCSNLMTLTCLFSCLIWIDFDASFNGFVIFSEKVMMKICIVIPLPYTFMIWGTLLKLRFVLAQDSVSVLLYRDLLQRHARAYCI